MHYVVMDLEWNNTYCKRLGGFINEIIEIGAVKLDENLKTLDTFSEFVKPQISRKLQGRVKRLTNLTNEEINTGDFFQDVIEQFGDWIGEEPTTVLTWADGDIRTLISNYRYYFGTSVLPFAGRYVDLQKYCQSFIDVPSSQQIGLSTAAEQLGINPDLYSHHRALDDSVLSADCLRKVFHPEKLAAYTKKCDAQFYHRLEFKPHAISNINHPLVDKSLLECKCIKCGETAVRQTDWKYSNQYFRADFKCENCGALLRYAIRFKKYYDHLDIRHTTSEIDENDNKKRKRHYYKPKRKASVKNKQ
ncbi:MAG: exonuclease domain-containing protein [Clostridiales bacterium]|nr:exonuclease domain-containing protein [Clostridia bacterium]MCR4564307.1 exonuclease domain-containing protein [Clostridiales bacterium]